MLMGMMIVVGFIVGFLVGCTGMGGIILIPALVYLSGLSSHVAMGTTLFTFIFTTSLCSWLYIRLGHVDWKATIPICIGGFLFTYVGADVKAFTAAPYLNLILALLILLAGALVFCPVRGRRFSFMEEGRRSRFWVLFAVGSGVGFVAGLTGAGGPVLSVPIMIALGFPPLIAIGAGQVYSVPVALSGSAANIGKLLNRRHYYFVPFRQDDPVKKPTSLVADFSQIPQTLFAALEGRQLQPLLA